MLIYDPSTTADLTVFTIQKNGANIWSYNMRIYGQSVVSPAPVPLQVFQTLNPGDYINILTDPTSNTIVKAGSTVNITRLSVGPTGSTGPTGAPSTVTGPTGAVQKFAYSGFYVAASGSPITLTSAYSGYLIQVAANIILPLASTIPLGGIIAFVNHTTSAYTITVNNTSTEFIYNGNTLATTTRSVTIQGGETLSLVSRGGTEWDLAAGSVGLRYQSTPPVLRSSVINQPATTLVSLNTIKAYMSTAGALWLGTNTGSAINVYGQATITYFGAAPGGSTIALASLNSMTSAVAAPGGGHIGDIITAVVTDTTNGYMYRITSQQYTTSQSDKYNIVIEQLG
jgi:hypothetical protein